MLLVVDVGNTQTHVGLMDAGDVVGEWRLATVRHRTSDEIAGLLQGFFSLQGLRLKDAIDEVVVLPCAPATVIPTSLFTSSARSSARLRMGMWSLTAANISGLLAWIAEE